MVIDNEFMLKRKEISFGTIIFSLYIVYLAVLWMFVNYGSSGEAPYKGSTSFYRWLLITIPLLIWMFGYLTLLLTTRKKYNKGQLLLILYIAIELFVSVVFMDIHHAFDVLVWALPFFIIYKYRLSVDYRILNILFLVAIVAVIATYVPGISLYGYFPGQTIVNLHNGLWWRVSIWNFVTPPYSAAFSLLILLCNLFFNKSSTRYIFIALAIYFIIFSANRTADLILIYCGVCFLLTKFYGFRNRALYVWLPAIMLLLTLILQLGLDFLTVFLHSDNAFMQSLLFRSTSDFTSSNVSNGRAMIMIAQFILFSENPVLVALGGGASLLDGHLLSSAGGDLTSSDAYLTHLIMRDGVFFILFIYFIVYLFKHAMRTENLFMYLILLMLVNYSFTYGAFMNFSNPVFVMMVGVMFYKQKDFVMAMYAGKLKKHIIL